ncbi:MAG: PAS domain S-box protein [Verrucomicrobiales bacterium]|nr:PAS domain S-box protein [Verrucomicrobiales bacterium]
MNVPENENPDVANDRFRAVVESAPNGIVVVSQVGLITMVNQRAEEMFGYSRDEFMEMSVDQLVPNRFRGAHPSRREGFHSHPKKRAMGAGRDLYAVRKDGGEFPVEIALTPLPEGDENHVLASIVDITQRKRLEVEIVRISENEQRRIGQDLHDDLCSQLSGIGCLTKVIEQKLASENPEEAALVKKVTEMVGQAGIRAREIAKGLVPTVLETKGLSRAIVDLVSRQQDLYGIKCEVKLKVSSRLDEQLPSHVAVQLYRITQEAVANAIKHSDCDSILVELKLIEGSLELSIRDDGKGMQPNDESEGMGFFTMKRRAEVVGAALAVSAAISDGTEIKCSLPFALI